MVPASLSRQAGLTLLEVLIAISMFALIGAASFRVLTGVIDSRERGDTHSIALGAFQKSVSVLDRDLRQVVNRPIRNGPDSNLGPLLVNSGDHPLEFTRGGWQNPLSLSRSRLQRVAYDIGPHPKADDPDSSHYDDETRYLRRLYWTALDRGDGSAPIVQVLLPGVDSLQVTAISNLGQHTRWPPRNLPPGVPAPVIKALEFSFSGEQLGQFSRVYSVELH